MATKMHRDLFYHKTWDRVDEAANAHDTRKHGDNERLDDVRVIYWAKKIYRGFLEEVIAGEHNPDLSEGERENFVNEAYKISDFDWQDKEKFEGFFGWIKARQKDLGF